MPEPSRRIEAPRLLLVEGEEEARFWRALFRRSKGWGGTDVQLVPVGRDRLTDVIPVVVATPGFEDVGWVGVSQDADLNPGGAFERIRAGLRRAELPVPARPWERTGSDPCVVAYVMPDGTSKGDLEALLWQALAGQPARPCVEAYFACLRSAGLNLPRQMSKAHMHAYLASLARPDYRLAEAEEAGLLPLEMGVLSRFLDLVD